MGKEGLVFGLGVAIFMGVIALSSGKSEKTSGNNGEQDQYNDGPIQFTLKAVNIPAGASGWVAAFQDAQSGIWYQYQGIPLVGSTLKQAGETMQFLVPVSAGNLSIQAIASPLDLTGGGLSLDVIDANLISVNALNGQNYVFDFMTDILSIGG